DVVRCRICFDDFVTNAGRGRPEENHFLELIPQVIELTEDEGAFRDRVFVAKVNRSSIEVEDVTLRSTKVASRSLHYVLRGGIPNERSRDIEVSRIGIAVG